jgi:hypothetical protein
MAVIWHDERITPERMIKILEDQRRHWLETANSFDRLKTYLTGTFSLQDADGNASACRARATQLQVLIDQYRQQHQLEDPTSSREEPRPPYLQ